jgi:electron transport complex protein RnfD
MVGRAFVMFAFTWAIGAGGYVHDLDRMGWLDSVGGTPPQYLQAADAETKATTPYATDAVTAATPMTAYKNNGQVPRLLPLLLGNTVGSLGETNAIACILGGAYLCIRRTASWEIPAGVLLGVLVVAGGTNLFDLSAQWGVLHELLGGALLFGAFFIATDPVSSPLTPKGKFVFGLGVGLLIILLRRGSNYPEGVMFAVLLMNAITPLINRWTVPKPMGGAPVVAAAK